MNNYYTELVKQDWLGRSEEDYTYSKKGLSIGWEETLLKDDPYSRFIVKVNSENLKTERKLLLTKQACNNLLSRMNVKKQNVRISFTEQFISYQRGNNICVTLEPLGDRIKFPSFNHRLDPILGFCVHEIAHFLYTDVAYDRYLEKFKGSEAQLKKTIMNVLEDERIEQIVATTFRGYTGYIGKAKDYCFGRRLSEEMRLNRVDMRDDLAQLLFVFLHLLRYPKALTEDLVNKFEKEIKQFMKILTPYPSDIPELVQATEKIYKVFEKFHDKSNEDEDDDQSQDQQQQQGNAQSQSSGGNVNSKNKQEKSKSEDKDSADEDGENAEGDNKEDKTDQQDEQGGENGDNNDTDTDDEMDDQDGSSDGVDNSDEDTDEDGSGSGSGGSAEDMAEALKGMLSAIQSSAPKTGDADEVAKLLNAKGEYGVERVLEEISKYGNDDIGSRQSFSHVYPETENLKSSELSVVFQDAKELNASSNHYDRALQEVRGFASSLRAKIQQLNRNHTITNSGLFEGDFDDGLLVDSIIGAKNIYKQDSKIMNRGACVALLIDESGSMGWGNKWFEAQKIAVMFERALEGCNGIDFYCYGHTTGQSTRVSGSEDATWINVYYEGRKNSDRKILGKIHNHNTNRDGHAILETIGRMRSKVPMNIPIIMFMISDGEPSASVPSGYTGKTYTKKAVNTVEKFANSTVLGVAIDEGIPMSDMYKNYIELTDHVKLVRDIGAILKKIITGQNMPIETI